MSLWVSGFTSSVDISLEKKDPKRKLERRLERKRRQSASVQKLVRTRCLQMEKTSSVIFHPRFESAFSGEQAISVSTSAPTGCGVAHEPDSRSSTSSP
jgi:hypothetical protein